MTEPYDPPRDDVSGQPYAPPRLSGPYSLTGQNEEGLVSEEMVERAVRAHFEEGTLLTEIDEASYAIGHGEYSAAMRAALAAVAPDIEARVRRECAEELERITTWLHSHSLHPDFEYATTKGPRKTWDYSDEPPEGADWERNTPAGRDGWERFDYHEESYWRRLSRSGRAPASGQG